LVWILPEKHLQECDHCVEHGLGRLGRHLERLLEALVDGVDLHVDALEQQTLRSKNNTM
jgi:hypothetical protein